MLRDKSLIVFPKVMNAVVALHEIVIEHRVEKVLSSVAERIDKPHCSLAFLHLRRSVTAKADAPLNP